jgi:hypothetical protein
MSECTFNIILYKDKTLSHETRIRGKNNRNIYRFQKIAVAAFTLIRQNLLNVKG